MTLEISLETRGDAYLRQHGANPVKYGQEGLPDKLVLWGNGLHFWIEWKKEKTGRLRPAQKVWAKYLKQIGDCHYIVDRFEQVVEIVRYWEMTRGPATARRTAKPSAR